MEKIKLDICPALEEGIANPAELNESKRRIVACGAEECELGYIERIRFAHRGEKGKRYFLCPLSDKFTYFPEG